MRTDDSDRSIGKAEYIVKKYGTELALHGPMGGFMSLPYVVSKIA